MRHWNPPGRLRSPDRHPGGQGTGRCTRQEAAQPCRSPPATRSPQPRQRWTRVLRRLLGHQSTPL